MKLTKQQHKKLQPGTTLIMETGLDTYFARMIVEVYLRPSLLSGQVHVRVLRVLEQNKIPFKEGMEIEATASELSQLF